MINSLINRYLSILKGWKLDFEKVSNRLGVTFSKVFSNIAKKTRYDVFRKCEFFAFDVKEDDEFGVLHATLRLRESMGLPHNVLFLAEDDASLWFMKCFGDHEEIFWIRIEDGENFCQGKPLEYDYDHFPTFEAFFEFLLDEEEKMRKEEESEK